MQGIKATTESREPKDLNNSSTARSNQRKDRQLPLGILSTWELPTHHQYTLPDAHKQLHLLLPTHEMWELPTPLIAANNPSREMRYTGITRSSSSSEVYGNYPLVLKHRILVLSNQQNKHSLQNRAQQDNACMQMQQLISQQGTNDNSTKHTQQST
ncbi:Cc-nbs resistance protein [Dorcoceras hygrometricum]|uniref:Cc-nbs resistance protein n=1 Tax=Dorcoceras hygrometricum TaxID=472368 RepID=A0A2Z7AUI9_9LAMI|nr:Cc-nbs resistance protein [Dorcoceras hygrometricum]